MKNLLRRLFLAFFSPELPMPVRTRNEPSIEISTGCLNDLLGNAFMIEARITRSRWPADLDICSRLTIDLARALPNLPQTAARVERLHTRNLVRRCELLAQQYLVNEDRVPTDAEGAE